MHPDFETVAAEVASLVADLRAALRDAVDGIVPDTTGARACGRALGLARSLGWGVFTVLTVSDPPAVLRAMPRRKGWAIVLAQLERSGCDPKRIRAVQVAADRLLGRLEVVGLDRLVLRAAAAGGLDTAHETTAMVKSRRAMRVNAEEILGLHAQAQLGAFLIGPPDRQRRVDLVGLIEYESLKRMRPGYPFPIHQRVHAWHPSSKELKASSPLRTDSQVAGLVRDLSTKGIAGTTVRLGHGDEDRTIFFHGEDTVVGPGIRAAFAECVPKGGTVGGEDDRVELDVQIHLPMAYGVMEVWIHRSIPRITEPAAILTGTYGATGRIGSQADRLRIPLEAEAKAIDSPTLPARLRTDGAKHATLLERGAETLKCSLEDFVGYRVIVPDPPIGSRVMLKWKM